ncbi:Cro/C1-type HTH DNA-binding domain-containing protein [Anaerovirgula multivorans]|uniref:Cro/C1-type HTH DNA-binding domain-containing protein n=1 Tax=Anaerovirgula multivorans TaxID=312168 RepID=A0A239I488_9FIRM|nr:helix-turn-helix transcriptional regulator [Anaerovirgula multivorans]SNS88410.1 Cro/C1-type HTH DNA-binding domain-containing protein [Anaerovirgula multivorans]
MTIQQLLQDMQMSRYRLSKISGIPWATLADIYSGKTHLNRCGAGTLSKLSKTLGLSIEELLALETEPKKNTAAGKPNIKTYLETGLSESVQKAIKDYLQGEKEQVLYLDCLWNELYGAINADLWAGLITEEQASYLRVKYLGTEGKEDGIND